MKFLDFLTDYFSRILLFATLILLICFSVGNFNKGYDAKSDKIKSITEIHNAKCKIVSFPVRNGQLSSFVAKILSADEKELCGLKVYISLESVSYDVYPNDTIALNGEFYLPDEKGNDGGFDSVKYNKSENIHGNVYAESAILHQRGTNRFIYALSRARAAFTDYTGRYFHPRYAGIVKALVTGEKSFIQDEDALNLQNSGVYHIVAISGLHLNIFIMIFPSLISLLRLKRFKKALLTALICSGVSVLVLLFTGFGMSVIRAFAMLLISLGSSIFSRRYNAPYALGISSCIILIAMPSSIYSVGYQLSVLSTYGVLSSLAIIKRLMENPRFKRLGSSNTFVIIMVSLMCSVFTLPVVVSSFGFLAVYSFAANILILPLVTPALTGSVLFGIVSALGLDFVSSLVSYAVTTLVIFILNIAKAIASLPFATLNLYPLYTLYICTASVFMGLGIYLLHKNKTIPALCLCLILAIATGSVLLYNSMVEKAEVIFADVAQGDCTIIKLPQNEAVMVDFGTQVSGEYKISEIKKTLVKLNIRKLSAIFVSHYHTDHISGVKELAAEGLVNTVILPKYYDITDSESYENYNSLMRELLKAPVKTEYVKSGSSLKLGKDARFDILLPSDDMFLDANDMSLLIKFSFGDVKFLFTGDMSEDAAKYLENKDIKCDVLKVPHHGGNNKYIRYILEKVSPRYAVISCGENNTYGHPHPDILAALSDYKTKIYRTDKMGAVRFEIGKEKIKSVTKTR